VNEIVVSHQCVVRGNRRGNAKRTLMRETTGY